MLAAASSYRHVIALFRSGTSQIYLISDIWTGPVENFVNTNYGQYIVEDLPVNFT